MANMTFKTNLLPNLDYTDESGGYSLGSIEDSSNPLRWKIHGSINGAKIFYGTCAEAVAAKTCVCPEFTANDLVKGTIIYVTMTATNTGAVGSLTLNVNGTGAKPIKYMCNSAVNNIPDKGYILANQTYIMHYDGTNWVIDNIHYNTDNNTIAYQVRYNNGTYTPTTVLYRNMLLLSKNETQLIPMNTTSNSTATTKTTITTDTFNPFLPIYYYNTSGTVNANAAIPVANLWTQIGNFDLRYSFNTGTTLTNNKDVYIVATPITPTTAQLAASPISQTLPSTEDGYIYIKLGHTCSTSNVTLTLDHPVFWFKDGQLRSYTGGRDVASITRDGTTFTVTRDDGSTFTFSQQDNNTATAADNILDGSNSGTQITYAPYSAQQAKLSFDVSSTNPTRTDRLNLNGYLYATKLYSGANEVLTTASSVPWSSLTNVPTASSTAAGIIQIGTGGTQAAAGDHTHTLSLDSDTGASTVSLTAGNKFKLTAGGQSIVFTTPSAYSLQVAKNDTLGGVKPWYSHTKASTGPTTGSNATAVAVNAITSTAGKYYAVESDSDGRLFVNIPWENTWTALSTSAAGYVGTQLPGNTTTFLRGDGTWSTPSYPVTSVATKTGAVTLGTLTVGDKTYNGSADTTIEIADLGLASTTTFLGITSTNLSNGDTTSPVNIVIGPTTGNVVPSNGSVVMEQDSGEEYIWTGNKWNLMGLASSWALANHIHGNILNNGTITSDTTKTNGQHLVITDSNNKVARSDITLGTATNTYLRNDGTWAAPSDNNTTYSFTGGTNGFTVTSQPDNSTTTVTVTPSIADNITGTGVDGYLAKFNGTNTITSGPQLGTSTTNFLNEAGNWAAPEGDHKVTQKAAITSSGSYPVILGYSTTTSTDVVNVVNTTSTLNYNPSTQKLHVPAVEFTSASYGETLPETGTNGQVFFQLSNGYTYEIPAGGTADDILVKNSATDRDVVWTRDYVKRSGDDMTGMLTIGHSTYGQCLELWSDQEGSNIFFRCAGTGGVASDTGYEFDTYNNNLRLYRTVNGGAAATAQMTLMDSDGYSTFVRGYGAVWNDYAEFRETKEDIEPGRCIRELGDDTLELTTERLMRGCEIVSDTFGFAIGKTEKAKTPTAASGRVLAYLYEDREEAKQKIGWPVCSGPNGTVSIMTEEEEERYPSRIIGTISAVPDYKIWHGGDEGKQDIQVNGRIWIRVR